ncbi:MAG: DUF1592 domain-containing protein [Myxococcota bacterium]
MKMLTLLAPLLVSGCFLDETQPHAGSTSPLPDVDGESLGDVPLHGESEPIEEPEPGWGEPDTMRRLSQREIIHAFADLYALDISEDALPQDNTSFGFENDRRSQYTTTQLIDASVNLAAEMSARIIDERPEHIPCLEDAEPAVETCLEALITVEGRRLFRRPVTDAHLDELLQFATDALPEDATYADRVALTLQAMMVSPEFLYFIETPADADASAGATVQADGHTVAARLASFFWESVPDDVLLDAADDGTLQTPAGLQAQVERMVEDPRFRWSQTRFIVHWLHVEKLDERTKQTADNLDEALRAAAVEEIDRFVHDVLIAGDAPFSSLFLSTEAVINPRLAALYEVDAEGDWSVTDLPERPGLLTRFGFLAAHGHPDRPSPVLRGVTINNRLFCRDFPPPPANAESAAAEVADGVSLDQLTNREEYELTTQQGSCNDCHQLINPPGFALEQFDTMGRFRLFEGAALPVNPEATVQELGDVLDATDMMEKLAVSPVVQDCAARHWLRFAAGGARLEDNMPLRGALAEQLAGGLPFGQIAGWIAQQPDFLTITLPE